MNTNGQISVRAWLALPDWERQHRAQLWHDANDALQDYESPCGDEDDVYLDLNDRVADLEPTVPWWIRDPALPHPGTRTGAALNALYAVCALTLAVLIALTLTAP